MAAITYLEAIRQGIWEEMERDPAVFCIGEDIGIYGGAFKVTDGLIDRFGPERVVDTPISEMAIINASFGAALTGLRPVAEFQFMDFISCAFNQITNMLAKAHFRWGAPVPVVVRGPSGGGVHGGPFHSQNPETYFTHTPGLKVICPASAYDAKGLIKSAIRDNNPVLFFEHKFLYRRIKEELPAEDYTVPIGKARVAREGRDVSVITYAAMAYVALEAADILAKEGIELEVVDLRTVLPLDRDAIRQTVEKTNRDHRAARRYQDRRHCRRSGGHHQRGVLRRAGCADSAYRLRRQSRAVLAAAGGSFSSAGGGRGPRSAQAAQVLRRARHLWRP
jgi:pyruvate/2-oxoglutarate/acetoin dehydrogenase E1 component